mgnify:CR=1 FL=1
MNHSSTKIKRIVLMRVHSIALLRSALPTYAASAGLLVVSLYVLGREVFVAQVFRNMPNFIDLLGVVRFFEHAFLNTQFVVQVLTVAIAVAALWLARETAKLLSLITRTIRIA